jgi:hypothetical protein
MHSILSTFPGPGGDMIYPRDSSELSTLASGEPFDRDSMHARSSSNPRSGSFTGSSANENLLEDSESLGALSWLSLLDTKVTNAISASPKGTSFDYLGCFPLGFNVTRKSFVDVVHAQQRLKDMNLLDEIKQPRLVEIGRRLQRFYEALGSHNTRLTTEWLAAVKELAHDLSGINANSLCPIRAHIGLDSGFQIQPGNRFWAVYALDEDSTLNIFLSRNVQDIAGTILHTFLSSRGCPRHECFQMEVIFSEWSRSLVQPHGLPPRILNDIALLSPAELLKFLQHLSLSPISGDAHLIHLIEAACQAHLLDSTDFTQLKETSTTGYLSGRASANELVHSRIQWYRRINCQHPSESIALENFIQTNNAVTEMLRHRDISSLQVLTESLAHSIEAGTIDARIDLMAFSIFCAMRKHAFDEAYMEVTDRNTLFNDQSDQAAAFAELFATGARCEAYFDVTPSAFGKLLSDRYRDYHHQPGHEPPLWSDAEPSTPSAYAAAKIDVDPNSVKSTMSAHQRFTFLSVFAIPALLDILLLTTTGRGLYLSYKMDDTEKHIVHSATLALMISLLVSGAVGTWITCGGSYYLISMAFSAMNMFVVTRLVGGLAFTLAIAAIGMTVLGSTEGIVSGIIFALYLIALTSYLCLLATLANFQYPGSPFQSVSLSKPHATLLIDLKLGPPDHNHGYPISVHLPHHYGMDTWPRHLHISFSHLHIHLPTGSWCSIHWITLDYMVLVN